MQVIQFCFDDFDDNVPIFLQIAKQIRQAIVRSDLAPGSKLPSVRDFAMQARVNPNTMVKALQALEDEGLITTERTAGKYVVDDARMLAGLRETIAQDKIDTFISEMRALGLKDTEIVDIIKRRLQ